MPCRPAPAARQFDRQSNFSGPSGPFLNGLFTVTRKSRFLRQTTCAEFDCLLIGTCGKAEGAGWRAGVGTGREHEFARIVEC